MRSAAFLFLLIFLKSGSAAGPDTYAKSVQPFLAKNCYACHNAKLNTADLNLEEFRTARDAWEKVAERLQNGTMPPKGFPRPPQSDVDPVTAWIRAEIVRGRAERSSPIPAE